MQSKWWQKAVVYQIYPRSFSDSDADGIGDIQGIIDKLDFLNDGTENSLGIDAIWLNPIYPSPQYDFGYDIMDYCDVDPQYGTMADFERLLEEAHKRGIKIFMDIVPSVTSHLHPWFIESRSSKNSPLRDWYIWKDAPKNKKYPNNWLGAFGGRAWDWEHKTMQFYYHNSLPEQPDLNWRNPEVEKAVLSVLDFWFQKGVDGFRIDVLNYPYKDEKLRNNPPCIGIRPYDMQRHIYDKDLPESVEVGKKMRQTADKYEEKALVAEIFTFNAKEAARYYGKDGDGPQMVFNFAFAFARYNAASFRKRIAEWESLVPSDSWPSYFLSNHDVPRHITRHAVFRKSRAIPRAEAAIAMLLTLRGTPFLYMGEEIGMRSQFIKHKDLMDPVGKKYWPFYGRDWARTPYQWNKKQFAGFSTVKPWLRVNSDYLEVNAENQQNDSGSLLSWYKKLIWLRKKHETLSVGRFEFLDELPSGVLGYTRSHGGKEALILLNFKANAKKVELKDGKRWSEIASLRCSADGNTFTLGKYGVLIAERTDSEKKA